MGITQAPENLKPEWVTPGCCTASPLCQDTGVILRASNGQFTATRFCENPASFTPRTWRGSNVPAWKTSPGTGIASRSSAMRDDHGLRKIAHVRADLGESPVWDAREGLCTSSISPGQDQRAAPARTGGNRP
ncbi:hypothetical protein M5585_27885 [Serratia ureilytica]